MNSLKERVKKLEAMIPSDPPWGDIYDTLILMDCTIGDTTRDEAIEKLGNREKVIE
jgi:hypothetical protein